VKRLPKNATFPVVMSFEHHHSGGEEIPVHMRCVVASNATGGCLVVDVPVDFYDKLELK
jgi:hypothetical protein